METSYDVVVIGSGFGGAVTACRLAQAGRSVCILERGRRWHKTEFPRSPAEVADSFWRDGAGQGFLEYKAFRRIDVLQGCGVGGGSLHYFNVQLRCPEVIFQRGWPSQITRPVLDPYYTQAEQMLESQRLQPPQGRDLPRRTQTFMAAARAVGRQPELVPIGVYTGPDRLHPVGGAPQTACDYQGNCMLGCNLHAKNSLDLNYIPLAEREGAEVYPLHQAAKIEQMGEEGYRVHFSRMDAADTTITEPGTVQATQVVVQVVVAAGTLGSSELLLRCARQHRSLPRLSSRLGQRFSGNGDFLLSATRCGDRQVDPGLGPSITAGADFSTARNRIFIEDLGYPNPFMWLLEGLIPTGNRPRNLLRAAASYLADTLGWGRGRVAFEADRLFDGGATSRLLPYLAMGTDADDGKMRLQNGHLEVDWSHRRSRQLFKEIEQALVELSGAAGGRFLNSVLWSWPTRKLLTAHPLGGCIMGNTPQDSVVDHRGQVWGHPKLFVADGSIIPTALSVNPSLTIAATAERIACWMIHDREYQGDGPYP